MRCMILKIIFLFPGFSSARVHALEIFVRGCVLGVKIGKFFLLKFNTFSEISRN